MTHLRLYPDASQLKAVAAQPGVMDRILPVADRLTSIAPPSVTHRKVQPVGFSPGPNDFTSIQTYWWPDPNTADGLPYDHRDGQLSPDVIRYDRPRLDLHTDGVRTFTLAAIFGRDESMARHAAEWIRVWFLDPRTRMNPHLRHAQFIPGVNDGGLVGCISLNVRLTAYLETVDLLLESFPDVLLESERAAFDTWWLEFLDWLWSEGVRDFHDRAGNNLGVYYDRAVAFLARRFGRREIFDDRLRGVFERRVRTQIEPDGRMPHELRRTRSFGYFVMNLLGFLELNRIFEGDSLFDQADPDGRCLGRSVDWLWQQAERPEPWGFEEIQGVSWDKLMAVWWMLPRPARDTYTLARVQHRLPSRAADDPADVFLRPGLHPFRPPAWEEFPELLFTQEMPS